MKKIYLALSGIVTPLVAVAPISLASCKGDGEETKSYTVTVTADTHGTVSGVTTLSVKEGTTWGEIKSNWSTTADDGYAFDNWYNGTNIISDSDKISGDISITAKFIKTWVVTVQTSTGGTVSGPSTLTVKTGSTWSSIKSNWTATPTSNDYIFNNWYKGSAVIKDTDTITSNVTITAKFTRQYTVRCVCDDGGTFSNGSNTITVKVPEGTVWLEASTKPTIVPDNRYAFKAWYKNGTAITSDLTITGDMELIAQFEEITLNASITPAWYYCKSDKTYAYGGTISGSSGYDYTINHFNDLPIGYISVEAYFDDYWAYTYQRQTYDWFDVTTKDSVTTIKNKYVSSDNTCVIDHVNQTITFADYEKFIDYWGSGPMQHGCEGGEAYYDSITTNEYKKGNSLVIDLKKYNIKTFCYDGKGYIPWEFYYNIFYLYVSESGIYSFDYNGAGLYQIYEGAYNDSYVVGLKQAAKKAALAATDPIYNDDNYFEYLYNLLALTLDVHYGLPQRVRRDTGDTVTFLPNGAYAALASYKDSLKSRDADVSSDALRSFMTTCLDDGGHTGYYDLNNYSTKLITDWSKFQGEESQYDNDIYSGLFRERYYAGLFDCDNYKIKEPYKEYSSTDGSGTIAYITFDEFEAESGYATTAEQNAGRELPSGTTDSNYMDDTLRLTMYANKKIKANSNIKNVVVDISCNGGGVVYTEFFIASWLCGGVRQKIYNPHTKSYCDFTVKADIDGDGDFDSNDYLSKDINLYILTSTSSFSCGNMLPCNVQDNRPSKTTFIGTKSGGGACYVDSGLQFGLGSQYQISSNNHMLRLASTSSNFVTVDTGCTITSGWSIDDWTAAGQEAFYDRDAINAKIWAATK